MLVYWRSVTSARTVVVFVTSQCFSQFCRELHRYARQALPPHDNASSCTVVSYVNISLHSNAAVSAIYYACVGCYQPQAFCVRAVCASVIYGKFVTNRLWEYLQLWQLRTRLNWQRVKGQGIRPDQMHFSARGVLIDGLKLKTIWLLLLLVFFRISNVGLVIIMRLLRRRYVGINAEWCWCVVVKMARWLRSVTPCGLSVAAG